MILLYCLVILIFPVIIGLNILTYRFIVNKALKKHIKPMLEESGLIFIEYKWPGLLSNGEFKPDNTSFKLMNKNGNMFNSMYAYIFYKKANETKKFTVRIDTTAWYVNKVAYSSDFKIN
jgi:hypothetical protein